MNDSEIQAWRDIIATNTVTTIALVKLVTRKGLASEQDVLDAVEETKKELSARKPQ